MSTRSLPLFRARLLNEVLIVGVGYLVYSQVRGLAADRVTDAFRNGYNIVDLERDVGIFEELAIQTWVLSHDMLVDILNVIYFYGLFPLLLPTAVFLFWRRPAIYVLARNAFLISGGIAVIFYLTLPTAPPRLLELGFIDTLNQSFTPTYDSIPPSPACTWAGTSSLPSFWRWLSAAFDCASWSSCCPWRCSLPRSRQAIITSWTASWGSALPVWLS
jgi:PAP2 superfamily